MGKRAWLGHYIISSSLPSIHPLALKGKFFTRCYVRLSCPAVWLGSMGCFLRSVYQAANETTAVTPRAYIVTGEAIGGRT